MFNLIVSYSGLSEGQEDFPLYRIFEYTDDSLQLRYKAGNGPNWPALAMLPCLFVTESNGDDTHLARVGRIVSPRVVAKTVVFTVAYDGAIQPVPNSELKRLSHDLGIDNHFEFDRTHWAVKDADLFHALLQAKPPPRLLPSVFKLNEVAQIQSKLASVMMPFDAAFAPVLAALQAAAQAVGMACKRGDDIWVNPQIIQDVVDLIDSSRVVICDCTGRNPNVFYEIGIAHTLGREVILIAQSDADVPFDLRHLRYIKYFPNAQGLATLGAQVTARLQTLLS